MSPSGFTSNETVCIPDGCTFHSLFDGEDDEPAEAFEPWSVETWHKIVHAELAANGH